MKLKTRAELQITLLAEDPSLVSLIKEKSQLVSPGIRQNHRRGVFAIWRPSGPSPTSVN